MKVLYIGAGTDTTPLKILTFIKQFIFIDCQPFSEFGKLVHTCESKYCSKDCIGFSRPRFLPELKKNMERIEMKCQKLSENKLEFTNGSQTVTYFINTSIPEDIDRVKDQIKDFDNILVMGHDPDSTILNFTNKIVNFWGNTKTYYNMINNEDNYNNLIYRLNREKVVRKKFSKFNLIKDNSVLSFDNWNSFLKKN